MTEAEEITCAATHVHCDDYRTVAKGETEIDDEQNGHQIKTEAQNEAANRTALITHSLQLTVTTEGKARAHTLSRALTSTLPSRAKNETHVSRPASAASIKAVRPFYVHKSQGGRQRRR